MTDSQLQRLVAQLHEWARELGFQALGITDTQLDLPADRLGAFLEQGRHGSMQWLENHQEKRRHPALLELGTFRVISVRMDYWTDSDAKANLQNQERAYISRYALGRDYHKMMRRRLAQLADKLRAEVESSTLGRAFVDSAPVMEKPLAEKAGIGWQGKHTLIINKKAGSYFFLGEIYTDIPLPIDTPASNHCGTCTACITACPTAAIVAPYELDARRCITYQTIENKGAIDLELRPMMGNRVFGCDDCQLVCPWNKFAQFSENDDFKPRHSLDQSSLAELFLWSENDFLDRTQGSAIRRAGYEGWLRNIAVGLGNGPFTPTVIQALEQRRGFSALLDEHIDWALKRLLE
ncbi:4Fe-4S ferredoxin, iron-sulfur binding protein [gamma proteobacterium HdN1]|nr:4Fe-4S ferredoxin, iron-sulfur binding protein [gamma proteobacterium HdN1]